MASVNKAILLGNLGRDPEIWRDGSRNKASFSLATSRTYTDRTGAKVSKTEWHNIVMWNKLADIAQKYLKKGKQVYIEGEITTRSYEGKDKEMRQIREIVANVLVLVGNRNGSTEELREEAGTEEYSESIMPGEAPESSLYEAPF